MDLKDLVERYELIDLPKRDYDKIRIVVYSILFALFLISSVTIFLSTGIQILYSNIIYLTLFCISSGCMLVNGYFSANLLFFQHPVLVLSPQHVYFGTKNFWRTPELFDSRVKPDRDLQLVIVKDSHSGRYRIFLEERVLIDVGCFSELEKAQEFRESLKGRLSKFYPKILVSLPIYQNTAKILDTE